MSLPSEIVKSNFVKIIVLHIQFFVSKMAVQKLKGFAHFLSLINIYAAMNAYPGNYELVCTEPNTKVDYYILHNSKSYLI